MLGELDLMNRNVRLGTAARRRIKAGGPISKGRPSLPLAEWDALKAHVFKRAGWRCAYCKRRRSLDPNHLVKRSRGGTDTVENIVPLCRSCHDRTDWPYSRGRLIVECLGIGRFVFRVAFSPLPAFRV